MLLWWWIRYGKIENHSLVLSIFFKGKTFNFADEVKSALSEHFNYEPVKFEEKGTSDGRNLLKI